VENQIRPIALGKKNWLFAGSLRAGQRAANVMSLLHSARLNGHDVYANMKDILERPPTLPISGIGKLLPHHRISADYSLPSWEGQVQTEHPAKGEGDEHQAQER
jgi:hypothetical protein